MKNYIVMVIGFMMAGCVQLQPPIATESQAWQDFGQAWALKGYVIKSDNELKEDSPPLTSAQYKAYQVGYQAGKDEYCQQDPFVMGLNGRIYYGICNDVNRRFSEEYNRGKQSRAKR
ncbi:DUF2799 domain-containing protein [Vibrio sp. 10N.261.51.F12]|uniref:DUF2799 domain-containing protein n=1 Tax=Vibrio sp. 10N.261.51.F12 TaxID=3229679 RepID=UPI0035543789